MTARRVALALTLPLVIIGVIILIYAHRQPAPHVKTTPISHAVPVAQPAPIDLTTTYYSFQVPDGFRTLTSTDEHNAHLIHTQAIETRGDRRQVGVTSNLLPSDGLDGVADYHLRTSQTATYQPYTTDALPPPARAFRTADGGELTLFLAHDGRYASISVSGSNSETSLRELLLHIYKSWKWTQ